MYDVAIIGAGIIGGMIARELSFYRLKVCILEKENDVAMGATKANSAIVHAGFDAKVGTLKAKLNVRGSEMMEEVAADLGVKYIKNGSLVVGFNDEDKASLAALLERGQKNGEAEERFLGCGYYCFDFVYHILLRSDKVISKSKRARFRARFLRFCAVKK